MKIIAVNGSARKNWNTHTLLNKVLDGAASAGAETKLINLYDLNYTGCTGCLGCKSKKNKNLGRCVVNDDLKPVLDEIHQSDGLALGSPIYLGDITGMLRSFWERFIFQYLNYDDYSKPLYTGKLKTAFVYTMNAHAGYYDQLCKQYGDTLNMYFEYAGTLQSTETLQMNDYSNYHLGSFDETQRKARREQVFPGDCQKAFDLGVSLAKK